MTDNTQEHNKRKGDVFQLQVESDVIFAPNYPKGNTTRRKANITEKRGQVADLPSFFWIV